VDARTKMAVPTIGSAAYYADPYPIFAHQRSDLAYRPVPGGNGAFGVFGYRDALALLTDATIETPRLRTFFPVPDPELCEFESLRHWVANSILHAGPARHRHLRALIERPLSPITVQSYQASIRNTVDAIIKPLNTNHSLDVVADVAYALPTHALGALLGIPSWANSAVLTASGALARWTDNSQRTRKNTIDARNAVDTLTSLVFEAIDRGEGPLLNALVARAQPRSDQPEALEELVTQCLLLLVAARATLRHLISSSVLQTLRWPAMRQALLDHAVAATAIVAETLRLECPVQYLRRTLATDFHGTQGDLPAGTAVLIGLGSAMRDTAFLADADRFDPTRKQPRTLAFGSAERACVGSALATVIAATALESFLRHRPTAQLHGKPRWGQTLHYRGLAELSVSG